MGVLTSAYSVPKSLFERIRRKPELINALLGRGLTDAERLSELAMNEPPNYLSFGKLWEERLEIYSSGGHTKAVQALKRAREITDPGGSWIRYLNSRSVSAVAKGLSEAMAEQLTASAERAGLTDYYGEPMDVFVFQALAGDIEQVKAFFQTAAEAGEYVVLDTA